MAGSLNKDGKKYAERSKSSMISFLLNENSNNYRRQLESKGIKPKNHHKQNLKTIEQIQRSVKQQKENKMKQANIKYKKPTKYNKIDSKLQLKQSLISTQNSSSDQLKTNKNDTNFIKRNMSQIHSQSCLNASKAKNSRTKSQRKPAIPTRSELNISKCETNKEEKDFVALNKSNASHSVKSNKFENDEVRFVDKKDYGKIPKYIVQRRLEMEELEQKKMEEEEARKIPSGMRKMTDEERLETLSILNNNKTKIIESIKNLPLVIETPSMIKYQSELNEKLKQTEETIKVFKKPTVFVAMDD